MAFGRFCIFLYQPWLSFSFFAASSFPATFTALVWLTFFLLIASAMAINKALKIKEKYLDKVMGLDEDSEKERTKDQAKN